MNNIEKQNLIIEKLLEDNWTIKSVEYIGRCELIAQKKWAEISITTEECLCHGGRMWITDKHTNNHYEISHAEYDESKGITDSSSELKYIIENEMMDYVNRYFTFIYKLTKINEYGKNANGTEDQKVTYYSDMETLAYGVCRNKEVKDIHLIDKVKYQCPNPDVYYVTESINKYSEYSWEKNRIWFKQTEYGRKNEYSEFKEMRSYEMYVEIFKKWE